MKNNVKKLTHLLIRKLGYQISKIPCPRTHYDFEREAKEKIAFFQGNTMAAYECLVTLFQQVRHCEIVGVPGCYVECGVWKGGAVGLMASANLLYGAKPRHIHLFDSFEDICEPDPLIDGERAVSEAANWAGVEKHKLTGKLSPLIGFYNRHGGPGSLPEVKELLEDKLSYDKDFIHYHKGWFQDTLPLEVKKIDDIAILRLDGDWYASTKVCLEWLYEKVVPGGFIIIDDYGAYDGCKKAVDEFMESRGINSFLNHVNQDCRYWIKK